MADEDSSGEEEKSGGPGKMGKLLVWGVLFVMGAGTGVATAMFAMPAAPPDPNAGKEPLIEKMDIPDADDKSAFIEFEEVVVNLNDERYSRFVTCNFSVQVANSQQPAIELLLDENKAVLMNWLIAHLRDKKLEDVRGKLGHNSLRREIHAKFNETLFTDGIERIQDVLFNDFKVQ